MKSGSLPRRPALWRSLMIPNFLVQTSHTAWFHPHMMLLLVQFCSWTTPSVRAAWHAAAVPLLSKVRQGFARFSNNNCIGDDTKAAAHRIPKCIRKTKNKFCGTRISVPLPKFVGGNCFLTQNFTEIVQSDAELWPKIDFQYGGSSPSWILGVQQWVLEKPM